jgi:hypothetical protein
MNGAGNSAAVDPSVCGDLWIQALTYFRDLPAPTCETYLMRALDHISEEQNKKDKNGNVEKKKEDILSPLLVLEIL